MKFYRSTHLLMCLSLETNVYHKDWPYSDDITQIVNFPTWISVTLTVLFFWIYLFFSDASICSAMAFPPLGNSDHFVASVSIDCPINSKQMPRLIM